MFPLAVICVAAKTLPNEPSEVDEPLQAFAEASSLNSLLLLFSLMSVASRLIIKNSLVPLVSC